MSTHARVRTITKAARIAAVGTAALALAAVAMGLGDPAKSDPSKSDTTTSDPAKPADAPTATPAAAPAPAPAPEGIPVPDGPVVNKQELEGGLIIEDIKIGDGYEVKAGGSVVAHYHGTLKADPTKVFDSSFRRGEPATFPLSGVIEGWQKGVPGMKIGGIRRLIIPAKMAYGDQARGPDLPANSDLVFIIQLVDALQIEDLKVGDGEAATNPCIAVTAYRVMDADGKEVQKVTADKPYIWVPGEWQGLNMGLEGMKVGGKRKISIPKELNITPPVLGDTGRPSGVKLVVEVELLTLRNLPQQRR